MRKTSCPGNMKILYMTVLRNKIKIRHQKYTKNVCGHEIKGFHVEGFFAKTAPPGVFVVSDIRPDWHYVATLAPKV